MPESRAALFLGVDVGITILTLGLVTLRVGYRWSKRKLAISDHLISTAMLASVIHMILDIISASTPLFYILGILTDLTFPVTAAFGYGRHQRDLPLDLQGSYKTALTFWLIQIFTKLPLLFSKLSLTFVYRDLIRYVDHPLIRFSRVVNYGLMVVLAGFFTAATLVSMFACSPVYKSWLPKTPGHCIDTTVMFNYVTGAVNVSTSICLICIPLPVLYLVKNKRIEIKHDTVISIVRLYMITDLYDVKKDFTWLIIPTHIMIVVEFNMTIIAASVVVMRPCFQAMFDILFPTSLYATRNASYGSKSKYRGARLDGYIMSRDENAGSSRGETGPGIVKTVDIELASKDASTEDILRGETRLRNPLDRPEWHR
ncbi:hypothetical protein VFPPC_12682 [Pochonia chlamydosporia 170]|uniref:Rhodopsin domain-containing protein n=1 Tax=Pochonia chlamydosporia 170 TaxID=1380566 RepID=A0A179G3R7_METCM|nr:hypothetical protein VFPPC_12682 [Pochonia chlamydosporia 170]OAQ71993.2 hypothetical protein VFPPC_12682 [Pochonia chlamydosporia 170]